MDDKDFIPIEKLNTRIEVYQEPSMKEKLGNLKSKAKDKLSNIKGRYADAKPKRDKAFETAKKISQFFTPSKGNSKSAKISSRLEARSKRPLSYQDTNNIFTSNKTDLNNVYRSTSSNSNSIYHMGSGNNPYQFTSNKPSKRKK